MQLNFKIHVMAKRLEGNKIVTFEWYEPSLFLPFYNDSIFQYFYDAHITFKIKTKNV